jgi:hypothetical protein
MQGSGLTTSTGRTLTMRVFRGDKSGGEYKEYKVPVDEGMVVLDAIHWIQREVEPELAVRWNCKARLLQRRSERQTDVDVQIAPRPVRGR